MLSAMQLDNIPTKEIVPGYRAKFIHATKMTLAYWEIKADASLPEHTHHHEQVVNVIEGQFELTVDGAPHILGPGSVFTLPPNIPHSGRSLTDCRIIDVFCPVREDYRDAV